MDYVGNLIRPPSEANSVILQVIAGCSYNKCTFCGAYKGTPFRLKADVTIKSDIQFAKKYCRKQKRMFLADGDVLILRHSYLVDLFTMIRQELPWIKRISLYGSGRAIARKSVKELNELNFLGLDRIYMGLESGCDEVLKKVKKGDSAEAMIDAGEKIRKTGLFLSVTVLLGLGGIQLSRQHALLTAKAINHIAPQQVAALTLMVLDNTALGQDARNGIFQMMGSDAILNELYILVSHLNLDRSQFHANHASNYLHLSGRLPKDKGKILSAIELALAGRINIVSENMRAL